MCVEAADSSPPEIVAAKVAVAGRKLVVGDDRGGVHVCVVPPGGHAPRRTKSLDPHESSVSDFSFLDAANLVLSGGASDGTIAVHDEGDARGYCPPNDDGTVLQRSVRLRDVKIIIGGWTLPAPPPKKAAPPPPPPPPPAAPAPIALYRVDVADHASVAAALAAAAAKGRKCVVVVPAGGAYDEAVAVPAGVTLRGAGEDAAAALRSVRLDGHGATCEGLTLSEGVTCSRGARAVALKRCLVSNAGDTGVASEAASLKLEHCVVDGCEDGVVVTRGSASVVGTAIRNCDCDGIFSVPKIQLLQDVTFDAIGRHEVNCKAGVVKTVGAAAAEAAAPSAAPLAWEGAEWVATPRA